MTKKLHLTTNLTDCDDVYQMLIDMHFELTSEESQTANAKLILALANHIGDSALIQQAINIVRANTINWRSEMQSSE
ncbi:MAG: hypothetical protein COA74_02045 [Gammaproteobacteria bacterium]|nr:MAG: hypothetical protein COA74_02045 [Gammaproteobacteria bacterium]